MRLCTIAKEFKANEIAFQSKADHMRRVHTDTLFCFFDFDLHLKTLICKFDPDILKMYLHTRRELLRYRQQPDATVTHLHTTFTGCSPMWGRGTPLPPCPFTSSSFPLFTFFFLSLALPIFFFCPSLPFLPE